MAVITEFADHDNAFREDVRRALVVPRPRGETWNVEQALDLKDAARRTTDEIAESYELVADGLTSVVLAVEDATGDEVAVDGGPEPGERPDDLDYGDTTP